MSEEKDMNPEDVNQIQESAESLPENGGQVSADPDVLMNQLAEAEGRASEYKESWARSQAEFQNYKKRIERDNELMYASMKGDIIRKVLPALDDLERALQNRPAEDAWVNGIELIARKLQSMLEGEGVTRIEAKGMAFDPSLHEAISHEPSDEVSSHHVIDVVQNGYMLGDRVIRPALVRVAQ